jgi:molybdopterin synthase sulfur carrier subunit
MSITVKFFASLRESLGKPDCELESDTVATAAEAWASATNGQERPPNTLIAVNMEYADADHALKDGDEVAFFPPVTGG